MVVRALTPTTFGMHRTRDNRRFRSCMVSRSQPCKTIAWCTKHHQWSGKITDRKPPNNAKIQYPPHLSHRIINNYVIILVFSHRIV